MARFTHLLTVVTTFSALAGCAAQAVDGTSESAVASEQERVTGGTSGDPAISWGSQPGFPVDGCVFVSSDGSKITYNGEPYFAEDLYCDCWGVDPFNPFGGRLRRDEPNAPNTYYCRAPFGCLKVSPDKSTVRLSSDSNTFVYGDGEPCNCPDRGITWGKLTRDDPNAPNTFYCRANPNGW